MKKLTIIVVVVAGLLIGSVYLSRSLQTKDSNIISTRGIHWHPVVEIYVDGEKQVIPAELGLGAKHEPIHTHTEDAADGVIHLEFDSLVRKSDTRLGNFFRIWDKDIRSFGDNLTMTVNGEDNTEFENYEMQDGDKIELRYE